MTAPEHLRWTNSTATVPGPLRQTRGRPGMHLPRRALAGVPGARGLR
jgi:hypothetical protein